MKKAFTMIELIFVIVVIGVLAAIAIPKLSATRDDAILTKMEANARVILGDFQMFFMANGHRSWIDETMDGVTNMPLDTTCGNPVDASTQISPNTFALCHDNVECLTFTTSDENTVVIADGIASTDFICEEVKKSSAIKAISNKSYQLGGSSVVR